MDNGELLDRNLLDRVAEHVGVLEPDVRQVHDARTEDVRRVEPAAQPRLDDRGVDAVRRELRECRRACSASIDAGRARAFDDEVATNRSPSDARKPSISSTSLSRRIEAQIV